MLGLNIITFAKSRDFIYKAGRRGEGTKAGLQNGPIRGVIPCPAPALRGISLTSLRTRVCGLQGTLQASRIERQSIEFNSIK
jgi:hypothetical protein